MSLLPYVIAFLMVLSAITYSRMDTTKGFAPLFLAYKHRIQIRQQADEKRWDAAYDAIVVKEVTDTQKNHFIDGTGKLNLKPLIEGDSNEKKQAYRELLRKLIYFLHQNEPYFIHAQEQDPEIVEHFIQAIEEKKIK